MRLVEVSGDHYQMGKEHALQVKDLRPLILKALESRLKPLRGQEGLETLLDKEREKLAGPVLEMIGGQAEGLEIDFDDLLLYDLASFLEDSSGLSREEGCSTWAASGQATKNEGAILVKNRDYYLEHLPLQIVVRARPQEGYPYLCVGSAGSPGVFGSGVNSAGLSVADSRVRSKDEGLGLPTYALMMHLMENCDSVPAALSYLRAAERMGGSNLILADREGNLAVFEVGCENYGQLEAQGGFLVSTNHFVTPDLQDKDFPGRQRENSLRRRERLSQELKATWGEIEAGWARKIMASHEDEALCRHEEEIRGHKVSTISTAIYLPVERKLLFCHGYPCRGEYYELEIR